MQSCPALASNAGPPAVAVTQSVSPVHKAISELVPKSISRAGAHRSGMRSATTPASRSDPTKPASGATTSIEASGASPHSCPHDAVSSGAQSSGSDQLAGSSRR